MGESEYKARERATIVAKYDAQRTPEILPGEEGPENQNNLDLYGFIYAEPVPESVLKEQRRIKQRDLKREKKWEKLTKSKSSKKSGQEVVQTIGHTTLRLDDKLFRPKKTFEKLVRRVYDGIPATLRSLIWTELLRIQGMSVHREKYKEMVERAKKYSPDIHQIDLDVNRTYRNTTYFRERYGPRQRQLFDVLAAYSMYNTDVGYCQGMSEIAAFLLMHLNEEADVFWALHTLLTHQHWQMHGFFIKGFPKLNRFFEHHDRLLAKHLPRLHKHLKKMDIHPSCYAFKWFMQCFIGLPFTLTLRLWDIFLVIGEKLLIVMSFNIMKIIYRSLMKMDQSEILVFMQEPLRRQLAKYGDDKIIEDLKDAMNELQYDWRPPKPHLPEAPPSPDQFGRLQEPHLVHERQADQADVEATLRRSFQRSGSPRPPSSPSGDAPHRRSPPPPLTLPDGSLAVGAQHDGAPPSPYDNAPSPLSLLQNPPPPPQQNPPPLSQQNPPPQPQHQNLPPLPQQNPPPLPQHQNLPPQAPYPLPQPQAQYPLPQPQAQYPLPQQQNPPPQASYPLPQPQNPPPQAQYPLPQPQNLPPQAQYPLPQAPPPVIPSPPISKPPSIAGSAAHAGENPRVQPAFNGGLRGAVPKSHSLPEDVALASQLDLMKDYQPGPASRQVRSHASSPLELEPPQPPLESTI